jgi:RND family efflux transporter MFP subunit
MRLRSQISITILLAAVLAVGWMWFSSSRQAAESSQGKPKRPAATRVLVEPLTFKPDRVMVRAIGTGNALKSADIHPSVSGEVRQVRFKAGQQVNKGAVLIRLDDAHQRLALRLTEVALKKAWRDTKRSKKLASSGHASRTSLDTAETALESAKVRHAQAEANLADRTIVAPFHGVIGLTSIHVGDRVDDDRVIATLDDRATILVYFNLPEDFAQRIALGGAVVVRPSTAPGQAIDGTIFALASRIEPASRSLRVRAKIANADGSIRPGTSFQVEIEFISRAFPTVREVAVQWSRDGAYLWRASAGKAEKVFVKLVRRDGGRILIDGPLQAGELVVVEGVQALRPGQLLDPQPFTQADPGKTKGSL